MWGKCGYRPSTLVPDKIRTLDSAIQHVEVILCGGNVDIDHLLWYHMKITTCFLAHLSRRLKGELIVYRSIRRPCVRPSVNIFKLEYLRNQWANRNQILSEASLGWGIDCIRFWTR